MVALSAGTHRHYIDNPTSLADPSTVNDGNGILIHLSESEDASREGASRSAAQADPAPATEMPVAARRYVVDGAFSKPSRNASFSDRGSGAGGGRWRGADGGV